MPPEGVPYMPKSSYLSPDEIARVVRLTGSMGVTRYRLTGGEPLLRPDILSIVEKLRAIDTVEELSMTTNGSLLRKLAAPLRQAGLDRFNISLDSLDPERFRAVTRNAHFDRVRDGIEAAIDEGFPVKINVVVMAGMSEREVVEFVEFAVRRELEVRFLEFMPLCGSGWEAEQVLPIEKVRSMVQEHFALDELPRVDEPAQTFVVEGTAARVGFIAPLSEPFCENCSRIRISADGHVRPCLFSDTEFDLGQMVRGRATDKELAASIRDAVWNKPAGSQFRDRPFREAIAGDWATAGPLIRNIGG
jgi:cyclic pyranopterin phosphate synthase